MQSLEHFGVLQDSIDTQGPVDLKWACYVLRIFCPTSISQIISLCLEDFLCYSKIIYLGYVQKGIILWS